MAMIMKVLVFVLLHALSPAVVPAAAQMPGAAHVAFSPGDAVRVTVWQYADLSGQFDIDEDGTVIHPIYRVITLGGRTLPEARAEFLRVLTRYEVEPQFVVEPLYRITIGGEVRTPNVYTVSPHTTVLQAVAQAGGPTPQAAVNRVRLLRDGREVPVDLTRPHDEASAVRLRSGDQLMVDARRNFWRNTAQPALSVLGSVASLAYLAARIRGWR
jgi:protein involved in polysaccharide export with SLBB domain